MIFVTKKFFLKKNHVGGYMVFFSNKAQGEYIQCEICL